MLIESVLMIQLQKKDDTAGVKATEVSKVWAIHSRLLQTLISPSNKTPYCYSHLFIPLASSLRVQASKPSC